MASPFLLYFCHTGSFLCLSFPNLKCLLPPRVSQRCHPLKRGGGGFPDHTDKSGTPFPACPLSKALDQSTASLIYFILLGASVDWVLLLLFCALGALMRPSQSTASLCVSGDHDVLLGGSPASMNVRHLDLLPSWGALVEGMANGKRPACSFASGCGKASPLFLSALGLKALSQSRCKTW